MSRRITTYARFACNSRRMKSYKISGLKAVHNEHLRKKGLGMGDSSSGSRARKVALVTRQLGWQALERARYQTLQAPSGATEISPVREHWEGRQVRIPSPGSYPSMRCMLG